jgi:hypothetical protein
VSPISPYVVAWFRAFLLTQAIEIGVAGKLFQTKNIPWKRSIGVIAIANLASHPAVWFVFPELGFSHIPTFVGMELWAWLSETVIYKIIFPTLLWKHSLVIALIANATSLGLGLLLRYFFHILSTKCHRNIAGRTNSTARTT